MNSKISLGKYRHFKGDVVEVIGVSLHSETLEEFVTYKHITGKRAGENHFWIRPVGMFFEEVERDGKIVPRFKYISN